MTVLVHNHTVGDTLTPLGFKLRRLDEDGEWEWVDLTGLTVKFRMVAEDGTVVVDDSTTGITVTDAENGEGQYDFQAADVDEAGTYYAWIRVYSGTELDTYPSGGRQWRIVLSEAA